MSSIFLSHSSKDNAIAAQVKAQLAQWGHRSVFLDFDPEQGIPAGRDWEKELYAKLRECRAVIVLCSQASMASRWCFAEVTHAKAQGKLVFPIKIDDVQVDRVLTTVQVIDATVGWDAAYQRLQKGLLAAGLDPKDLFDWDGTRPPYPGLMAFQEQDAAVFFGRDKEIREGLALLNRLRQFGGPRLTLMLGASGSGKSSLMRAGLLPRLKRDQRWVVVGPFRPLKAPFDELAKVFSQRFSQVPQAGTGTTTDVVSVRDRVRWEEHEAKQRVEMFLGLIKELRENVGSQEATVLLMIDQCEELLAVDVNEEGGRFLLFLRAALERADSHLMVLATLRSDFLGSFQDHRAIRGLRVEPFAVPQMEVDHFTLVIKGPAGIAGLELEEGLVQAMINDTKTADALPLLAFTLRELWEGFGQDKLLTLEEYRDKLGRLEGCIARAAEAVLKAKPLSEKEISDLQDALLSMVRVADKNQYAKQQARWKSLSDSIHEVLERFVAARLLISSGNEDERLLEIAHDALLRSWPRLKGWIDNSDSDLRLIEFEEECAKRWHERGCRVQSMWAQEQAVAVQRALRRFKKTPSAQLQTMMHPQDMLIERLDDASLSHEDRLLIGQKLCEFGDPRPGVGLNANGLPDIVWIEIPGGTTKLERAGPASSVKPFRIAKYPVTNEQFVVFLKAEDGYQSEAWWKDIGQSKETTKPSWQETNAPRETVSWDEAIAFCRWISAKTGTNIRLPTEWEWQQAAKGGDQERLYPWEGWWDSCRCNSNESRLSRTTAVGMYPQGATQQGVMDMAGNVYEWCQNTYDNPGPEYTRLDYDLVPMRVIRGGSWGGGPEYLRTSSWRGSTPFDRHDSIGFRLAQDIP